LTIPRIKVGLLIGAMAVALCSPACIASTDTALAALGQGDNPTALKLFREAAGAGDTRAEEMLGQLLLNGKAGAQDPAEAANWFKKAADSGKTGDEYVATAQFNLAALYFSGRGLPKDADQALKYYTKSADNGFALAQKTLIAMYFQGTGTKADNVQALKWALVLGTGGDQAVVKAVAVLHQRMSADEFAKGKAAALKQFPQLKIEEVAAQAMALSATLPQRLPEEPQLAAQPYEARAQHYLDAHDYGRLHQVVDDWAGGSEGLHALDWLKEKMIQGETIEIAYLYAADLWRLGNSVPASNPNAQLKDTAAMVTTYAFAVIEIDGDKCKDVSAPGHNLQLNLSTWGKVTWSYMAALPLDQRTKIITDAEALEKRTAPLRKVDRLVCGGGIGEFKTADFSKEKEVPTPPGGVGKTFDVPSDPNYMPELKPEAEYRPLVDKARQQIGVYIAMVIEKLRDAQAQPH
jgi:TPR repeat protein